MPTLSFLWHLHQPAYRTADGVAHAPWAMLHAGGSYATLAKAIVDTGAHGHVLNIVPTLLEQLIAYRDGLVFDPVVDALSRPASELDSEACARLLDWAFHVTERQMERYPRLRELQRRRSKARSDARPSSRFGASDLRDLQVLFILAQAGEQAWRDDRLADLHSKGRHFSADDHVRATRWLQQQPAELIELWHQVADLPGNEISTSPFAHPIMPLLADTAIVRQSWAPSPAPQVPDFRHPEDARRQLNVGLHFMAEEGFTTSGCWPPEGSVSAEALAIYAAAGVQWLVTDEGILERSLERSLRSGDQPAHDLYRQWRLAEDSPVLFFRDRWLSDRIGFVYGRWENEEQAARDFVEHLEALAAKLPQDASIVVALDGENPWLHFPEGGGPFLRELMRRLEHSEPVLRPATLTEVAASCRPKTLPRLHPGSWINSVFATWIGHPEKTNGWRVLSLVREAIAASAEPHPPSLLLAEGSDWFWWLGDDNPTKLAPLYDHIFRRHLGDACMQAGIEPPVDLDRPLKATPRTAESGSLSELRFDPIKGRWSIIAPVRQTQPGELLSAATRLEPPADDGASPFVHGAEHRTAHEIMSIPGTKPSHTGSSWQVRVVPNSYPVLKVEGEVERQGAGLFDKVGGVGAHEVIVETPDPTKEMADLDADELTSVLLAYRARLVDLRRDARLRYVLIYKNKGVEAGATVSHAHSQLIATPIIPTFVVQELRAARSHFRRKERCIFCDLIREEQRMGERVALETDRFIAIEPFAAAFPFETWILPLDHSHDFAEEPQEQLYGLAVILGDFLRRIRDLLDDPPYNLVLHTAPSPHPRPGHAEYWATIDRDFHWHVELVPRITRIGGFEWGAGYTINPTPPEEAARILRDAGER